MAPTFCSDHVRRSTRQHREQGQGVRRAVAKQARQDRLHGAVTAVDDDQLAAGVDQRPRHRDDVLRAIDLMMRNPGMRLQHIQDRRERMAPLVPEAQGVVDHAGADRSAEDERRREQQPWLQRRSAAADHGEFTIVSQGAWQVTPQEFWDSYHMGA